MYLFPRGHIVFLQPPFSPSGGVRGISREYSSRPAQALQNHRSLEFRKEERVPLVFGHKQERPDQRKRAGRGYETVSCTIRIPAKQSLYRLPCVTDFIGIQYPSERKEDAKQYYECQLFQHANHRRRFHWNKVENDEGNGCYYTQFDDLSPFILQGIEFSGGKIDTDSENCITQES